VAQLGNRQHEIAGHAVEMIRVLVGEQGVETVKVVPARAGDTAPASSN
jgi:hypothetical protein